MRVLWPAWLWIGTPMKFWLWLVNRGMASTGVFYVWKRKVSRRKFWLAVILINVITLGALAGLFFWLR